MIRALTKSQAFLLTLYTGALLLEGEAFRDTVEKKLGRKVYATEFASEDFIKELQELYEPDWKQLITVVEDSGLILPK